MIRLALRLARFLGAEIDRAHLLWARAHLSKHNPMHPDFGYIVRHLHELEVRRG